MRGYRTGRIGRRFAFGLLLAAVASSSTAGAAGRLIATGGVTQIEGSAGGGIVPWALIAGYGTKDEVGLTAFYTHVRTRDFLLRSGGVAVGLYDRAELSFARQRFGEHGAGAGQSIEQDIVGLKVRLFGDAVFDQDRWLPQVAVGLQYKHNRDFDGVPKAVGARHRSGTDLYSTATKLFLGGVAGRNLLLTGTVRATKANQLGILGFGGDLADRYRLAFEGSAALLLTDRLAIGYEYRRKPNNLGAFGEDRYEDLFVAWLPNKTVALTAAYARLGTIASRPNQEAVYLSLQLSH